MKINITIKRVAEPDDKTKKIEKQVLQSLRTTEFPVGILHSHPSERNLHFCGTVEDFVKAVEIKKSFIAGSINKVEMNAKFRPIYKKSKEML